MKELNITGSYVQDQRHAIVSDRYNVIQPSAVGEAMANNGMALSTLSTGKAKHADKADFQRTLARYRGPEIAPGIFLDIIHDSKKLGRGVDRLMLGIYRMICTNGLFVGTNFFVHEIRHSGNTLDVLNQGILQALDHTKRLTEVITAMQGKELSKEQAVQFAEQAARLLVPKDAIQVAHRLLKPLRQEDDYRDLWTTFNVVQENAMRGRQITYTLETVEGNGLKKVRAMNTRAIKANTGKDAEFNQGLFDIALKLAA